MTPEAVEVPPEWIRALENLTIVGGAPDAGQIQMQANLWRQQCPDLADRLDALAALIQERAQGSASDDSPAEPVREYRLMGFPRGGFFG